MATRSTIQIDQQDLEKALLETSDQKEPSESKEVIFADEVAGVAYYRALRDSSGGDSHLWSIKLMLRGDREDRNRKFGPMEEPQIVNHVARMVMDLRELGVLVF